jgi:hypothetical protein
VADFCAQTSKELFGEDFKDLAGLCPKGQWIDVLCEECGSSTVDHLGVCKGGESCEHAMEVQ